MNLFKELKEKYPDIVGEVNYSLIKGMIFASGNIYTSSNTEEVRAFIKEKLSDLYKTVLFIDELKINEFIVNAKEGCINSNNTEDILDELQIIYQGMLPVEFLTEDNKFRDKNVVMTENMQKIDNCVKVLNFITPIVLDSNLKVIDGNKRLFLAKANDIKEVPVIIVNDCGTRSEALSLILNRTSEFQRWDFQAVDDFVDNHPQLQPILEPIGFFGKYVLPVSFFSDTVINYKIDPFNEKQKQYVQEEGLAEWAEYRRQQMEEESQRKREIKKKKIDKNTVSLFDLLPTKDDFVETYDMEEEIEAFNGKYKDLAENITQSSDAEIKERLEKTGGVWQAKSRTASQVAQDKRKEAIEFIEKNKELTDEEKSTIIEDIDNFADIYTDIDAVRERLNDGL